jgi:surfeit locus 1 family protein
MKRVWGLTVASIVIWAILLGLGTWQLQRRAWKHDLIATLNARMIDMPQSMQSVITDYTRGDDVAFRRVRLSGQFVDFTPLRLHALHDGVMGYHLLAPFIDTSARIVFVDLGFSRSGNGVTVPRGPRTLVARVRLPEGRGMRPANDLAGNLWYWRDMASLNADIGPASTPFTVEVETKVVNGVTPYPITPANLPNRHLEYALTWYSFAAIWAVIYALMLRRIHGAKGLSKS